MKTIFIVRHGETQWNSIRRLQGHTDVDLSDAGVKQAERLKPVIAQMRPDAVIASDLTRASRTAAILGYPAENRTDALRELHLGEWTGMKIADLIARDPDTYAAWRAGVFDPPGAETWAQMCARAKSAVLDALETTDRLLVVCHDGVVRALMQVLVGLDLSRLGPVSPASLSIVTMHDDCEVKLDLFNYRPDVPALHAAP